MSKAEDLAAKLIIPKQVDDIEKLCRFYYIKGYHQAEKDLELTWKIIEKICLIAREVHKYYGFWSDIVYQEVLKRFKSYDNN